MPAPNATALSPSTEVCPRPRTLGHIARVRVIRGHTQTSLAAAAGVDKRTIQRLEKGHLPSARTAARVSAAVNLPPTVLWPELIDRDAGVIGSPAKTVTVTLGVEFLAGVVGALQADPAHAELLAQAQDLLGRAQARTWPEDAEGSL